MATLERSVDRGTRLGRASLLRIGQDIRDSRRDRGLSIRELGAAAGVSATEVSRIERGLAPHVTLLTLSRLAGAVGLDLVSRTYPGPQPVRDASHLALLARFRSVLHHSVRWSAEVPLPIRGDQRSWDAVITLSGEAPDRPRFVDGTAKRYGVEAETRPLDVQALHRRNQLKLRDSGLAGVLLVMPDTRQARAFLGLALPTIADAYPVSGRRALELLRAGLDPGGSALIRLGKGSHQPEPRYASR